MCDENGRLSPAPALWGFGPTVGLTLVLILALLSLQVVAAAGLFLLHYARLIPNRPGEGLMMAAAAVVSAPAIVFLSFGLARLRKGATIREYFNLEAVSAGRMLAWIGAGFALMAGTDFFGYVLHRPVVPDVMIEAYRTAGWLPLLWLGVILFAPVGEEVVFRGFMFKGVEASRFGPAGAILLSALAWSLLHLEYDAFDVATIFMCGLLLGLARHRSRSLYVPVAMHVVWNLVATLELAWKVNAPSLTM